MSGVAGVELKYAIKKATAWNTALACGANDGILSLATSLKRDSGVDVDDSLGQFFSSDGTPGAVKVEGDLPMYLRYDGCDLLLALFMGIAGVPTLHNGGAASYDYKYDFDTDTDGLFATFVKHMKTYIAEVPSLKITAITIKGEQGKAVQLIAKGVGNNVVYDSSINTTSTFNNVTYREIANRVRFADGVFRMNSQSGIALASGDVIGPSSFELTATRKLTGVYGSYTSGTSSKQDLIDEPTNDGPPEISLKLQFPRHTSATRLTDLGNDARKKMDITFTGALIEGAIYRSFKLQFPNLQMKSADVVDEAGIIKEPVEFICHKASAAPTGMTGITAPVVITGVNQLSTNPLA